MSQAVVLMNGYVVYLNSITDHDTFNPETTPIIFDSYTGRVRQFTKGNITYMAVNDPKTDKFKHYVNATTFWNNATPINNSFQIESFSNYNSNVFKYSTIPFLLGVGQYGVGVDSGNGVAKGTKVILVREKIVFDSLGNASLKVDKKGFDFNQDKSCFQGDKTIKGNLCENENFDNIQHLTGYVEYPSVNILIGDDSLKKYAENIKNKKFKNEKTNEYYFIDADQKPIIDSINYLFFKILKNQPLINYLQQNGWYILFQKHFETINLFDSSSTLPGHAQRDYHKRYTERYFNLLYTRLVEFYFWSNAVRVNSLDKITVIIRLISLFTDLEISVLDYNAKIKLLEDILRNNLWVSGKWDALYSGTKLSEEEVVVKIIRAFYREENNQPKYTEIDNFLDYLASTPKYEVNNSSLLYQMLYKKIDDDILFGDTGQGAQGQYVRAVFDLWTFSKYNPSANNTNPQAHNALSYFTYTPYRAPARPLDQPIAAPAVINYESTNAAIWYIDNYDFNFENTLIKATERNAGVVVGSVVGYYHIYQPISLKQTDATDTIVRMPWLENTDNNNSSDNVQNGIPIFYLMYVDQAGDYSDAKATIGLAVDVFLTFTGIGEIKSIKYLTEVTSFRKYISGALQPVEKAQFLARISAALSGANTLLSIASITLSFTTSHCSIFYSNPQTPPNPNDADYIKYKFCQAADGFLFALEMVTLSGDLLAKRALKRATRKLRQSIPTGSEYNELRNAVNNIQDLADDLNDFLLDLQQRYPNLHGRVNNYTDEKKLVFMFDFGDNKIALKFFENDLLSTGGYKFIDDWHELVDEIKFLGIDIEYLKFYNRLTRNKHELDHVTDVLNTSAVGFDPKGGHAGKNLINGKIRDPNLPGPAPANPSDPPRPQTSILNSENGHTAYKDMYFANTVAGGFKKKSVHTIINPNWSDNRIKGELAHAFMNKKVIKVSNFVLDRNGNKIYINGVAQKKEIFKSKFTDGTELEIHTFNVEKDIVTGNIYNNYISYFQLNLK